MGGYANRADVCHVLVRDGGVRALEYHAARSDGGCAPEEAIWSPVGCMGGKGTVQGNSWCVLIRGGAGTGVDVRYVHSLTSIDHTGGTFIIIDVSVKGVGVIAYRRYGPKTNSAYPVPLEQTMGRWNLKTSAKAFQRSNVHRRSRRD
jgi:hypothetical protein